MQDSHYGLVQPAQAWIQFYIARGSREPAGRSHDPPVLVSFCLVRLSMILGENTSRAGKSAQLTVSG